MARAIQTDDLEMEVPVVRDDAMWIRLGDQVKVVSESGALNWEGTVIRKSQFVDEEFQRQTIFIRIKTDKNQDLLAGEYLRAIFPVRPIDGVMEIPRNSVFNSDEVFVVRQGRLAKERIEVVKENERTLLFKGVPEGDTIVVQQLINVSEGTLVQTSTEESNAGGPVPGGTGQPAGAANKGRRANR